MSVAVVLIIFLALLAFVVFAAGSYRSAVQAQQELLARLQRKRESKQYTYINEQKRTN